MSAYEERLRQLQGLARNARQEVLDTPEDAWSDHGERQRLEGVLAYAQTVLEATDPALVSEQAWIALRDALTQISTNAPSAPANAAPWGGQVIDALARLPVARGREVEQAVKDAAATFQR